MKRLFPVSTILGLGLGLTQFASAQGTVANAPTNQEYNVRAFGAVGDGKTLDSPAINKAIDAAAAAGGGTVDFPPGTYASLSIHLKSNIHLHLQQGAVLLAADRTDEHRTTSPNPTR